MSARALALRALASLAVVAMLVTAGIARLARVPRPESEVVARYASGEVAHERVKLAGRTLGYALRCGEREVFARTGTRPLTVIEAVSGERRYVAAGDGDRALALRVDGCEARIHAGVGPLRSVTAGARGLTIEGAQTTFYAGF